MAIWRLTPVDLDEPSWEASSHRGYAIIRAQNEDAAREMVLGLAPLLNLSIGHENILWREHKLLIAADPGSILARRATDSRA